MTSKIIQEKFKALFLALKKSPRTMLKEDARAIVFSLEAILRLHSKKQVLSKKDHDTVEKSLVLVKSLEDDFGYVGEALDLLESARRRKLELKSFEKTVAKRLKAFETLLKKKVPRLKKAKEELKKVSFPKAQDHVPKALSKEIKRIQKKIKTRLRPLIEKETYGEHEIQEGLHEWRRMIRWVALYFQAYAPLFSLEKAKNPDTKEKALIKTYGPNPFCKLGKGPIKIESVDFYLLSDYIVKTGSLKEEAEEVLALIELGFEGKKPSVEKRTQKLFKSFRKSKVLRKLRTGL